MNSIFKFTIGLSILTTALQAESGGSYSIDPVYIHMRENTEVSIGDNMQTDTRSTNYFGIGFSGDYTFENSWKIKGSVVGSITEFNLADSVNEEGEKIVNEDNIFVGFSSLAIGLEFVMNDQMTVSPLLGMNTFTTGKFFKGMQKGSENGGDYISSIDYSGVFTGFDMTFLMNSWTVIGELTYGVADARKMHYDLQSKSINAEYSVNKTLAHGPSVSLSIVRQISDSWTASLGSEYRHIFINSESSLAKADAKVGLALRF